MSVVVNQTSSVLGDATEKHASDRTVLTCLPRDSTVTLDSKQC